MFKSPFRFGELMYADKQTEDDHIQEFGIKNYEQPCQPTTQPTKCDVLYDLRGVWQSPHVC